jgi:hypothetical protein
LHQHGDFTEQGPKEINLGIKLLHVLVGIPNWGWGGDSSQAGELVKKNATCPEWMHIRLYKQMLTTHKPVPSSLKHSCQRVGKLNPNCTSRLRQLTLQQTQTPHLQPLWTLPQ